MQQMQLGNGLVQLLATLQRTEYLKNDRQKKRVLTNEDGEFAIDDGLVITSSGTEGDL